LCGGDKLDVDCFRLDVLINRGGTLVVHYVQCQMVATRFQYEDLYNGSIGARRHGPNDDCIKVVNLENKHVLHTFEGADREGTGMLVYMVPLMASTSMAKQNISCIAQIS
jgi:hypothetical protein